MVPAEGNLESAKLIIVGEQPGRNEAREGRPFVGPAGRVLMDVLGSLGISRQDCYITNTIKEFQRPLEYYFDQKNLFTGPGQAQIELLKQELKGTSQPVVLTGNVPLAAIYGFVGITKWRGSILRMPGNNDQFVIPTIHPATVLPPKCVYTNKLLIQYDLDKARRIFTGEYKPTEWKMEVTNSPSQTYALLDDYYQRGLAGEIVYYDIEIYNGEVSCISFSLQAAEGVCIPFMDSHGDRMSIENEANVWLRIARILEDVTITKAGQNIVFDSHFLLRKYGIKGKNFHDTMIAQRTLMPDYPIGLDFITSIWTDHKYYKDEGKAFFKGSGSWERLFQYNATDSAICSTALPKQLETLHSRNNISAYDRQRRMIEPLTFMMERGVRADLKGIQQEAVEIDAKLITLQEDLNKLAGRPLNPNSPKQLQEYLYGTLGHAPYRKRGPGGGITTDNNAIKRLIRKGVVEASIIQEIRGLRKLRSTYLEVSKFDSDGRLRCSYNPVGTKFSRLSSSENIFDTGMNMQNLNENLLKYLMADKGFVVYRFDLAQAENRIVAYVGNITAMIEAFENGIDLHKLTAALVFGKRIEDISDEKGSSTLGDGKHSERDWGKRSNHSLNYDFGYRAFAMLYEMPETQAKFIVDSYHRAYPGVRNTFHAMVKRMLATDRTIVNLLGRKTLFLNEWGDKLFKEAYSCIPQGTVGDIINEYGVEHIYYNLGPYYPIELLTQVHDEVGFQISTSLPWIEHAKLLNNIKSTLEISLEAHNRTFKIPADLSISLTFSKKHKVELKNAKWPTTDEALAKELETIYSGLVEDPANAAYFV